MKNRINLKIFKKSSKLLIPIFIFAIFDSAFSSFSSILAKISQVFPEASTTLVQTILTLPSLMLVATSLFAIVVRNYILMFRFFCSFFFNQFIKCYDRKYIFRIGRRFTANMFALLCIRICAKNINYYCDFTCSNFYWIRSHIITSYN